MFLLAHYWIRVQEFALLVWKQGNSPKMGNLFLLFVRENNQLTLYRARVAQNSLAMA